jgi:predicted aspartyl protease
MRVELIDTLAQNRTEGRGMSYLLGQLDPYGYPVTRVTVRPGPHAQVVTDPPPLPAVQVTAVIDTGANHSAVSPEVMKALGIEPVATAEVDRVGVAGAVVLIYPVRIEIPATEGVFAPFDLAAAGIQPNTLGADVLLGIDILKEFTFTYRGEHGLSEFTLSAEDAAPPRPDPAPGGARHARSDQSAWPFHLHHRTASEQQAD